MYTEVLLAILDGKPSPLRDKLNELFPTLRAAIANRDRHDTRFMLLLVALSCSQPILQLLSDEQPGMLTTWPNLRMPHQFRPKTSVDKLKIVASIVVGRRALFATEQKLFELPFKKHPTPQLIVPPKLNQGEPIRALINIQSYLLVCTGRRIFLADWRAVRGKKEETGEVSDAEKVAKDKKAQVKWFPVNLSTASDHQFKQSSITTAAAQPRGTAFFLVVSGITYVCDNVTRSQHEASWSCFLRPVSGLPTGASMRALTVNEHVGKNMQVSAILVPVNGRAYCAKFTVGVEAVKVKSFRKLTLHANGVPLLIASSGEAGFIDTFVYTSEREVFRIRVIPSSTGDYSVVEKDEVNMYVHPAAKIAFHDDILDNSSVPNVTSLTVVGHSLLLTVYVNGHALVRITVGILQMTKCFADFNPVADAFGLWRTFKSVPHQPTKETPHTAIGLVALRKVIEKFSTFMRSWAARAAVSSRVKQKKSDEYFGETCSGAQGTLTAQFRHSNNRLLETIIFLEELFMKLQLDLTWFDARY